MRVTYPDQPQDFGLTTRRNKRNAQRRIDDKLSLEDVVYHLDEIEKKVGANNSADTRSHDYRLRTVEEELDAITQNVVTEAGFGLTKNGNELAIANPITGAINVAGTISGQNGHGQFTDFPSLVAGLANLRNGVVRFYCIDTTGYIEIESPDGIAENRKQYLKDLAGKIPVEETDGTLSVQTAYKIGGTQVVGGQLASIAITQDPPVGTFLEGGFGFSTKEEFDAFVAYVSGLRSDIESLLTALTTHGLVATE